MTNDNGDIEVVGDSSKTAVVATDSGATKVRKRHRPRRIIAWVLVVLASLMIPLSIVTYWAVNTVTNTDHYVETLAPLARNHVITDHLATKATDELFDQLNVQQRVTKALPPKAAFLAAPLTLQAETFVDKQLTKILRSPYFAKLWDAANRKSHGTAVAVLTGHAPKGAKRANAIVVNVTPVLTKAIKQLDEHNFTVFNALLPQVKKVNSLSVTLADQKQLSKAQSGFHVLVRLKWFVPGIAVVLIGLAALVAVDRRKTLLRVAIGASIMTVVILAGLATGRSFFIHTAVRSGVDPQVTGILWDTVLRFLKEGLRWLLLILVVLALVLWVIGHSRSAMSVKHSIATAYRWIVSQFKGKDNGDVAEGASPFSRWTVAHINGLRIVGVAIAALIILLAGNLSGAGLLVIIIVLAIYLGALQVLVVASRRANAAEGANPALAASSAAAIGESAADSSSTD